jgi:Kef-type K+ transport system membrane component KefB
LAYEIIIEILIVLAAAVFTGEVFEQLRLPSVAGELLSGMVLGPTVLNVLSTNDQVQGLSSVSLFFIIFLIGFEMNTATLRKHIGHGLLLTGAAFIVPMLAVFGLGAYLLPFGLGSDFVVGLAIAVPSISIISVLVMQYNMLQRESGRIILSTVAITDIVAFMLLVAISTPVLNTISVIAYTAIFVAAFVVVDVLLNNQPKRFRQSIERVGKMMRREDMSYAALILVGLSIAAIFQAIGLSFIIGAFFAGLIVHDGLIGRKTFNEVTMTFTRINRAFFIPLFFGLAGLEADLPASSYGLIPRVSLLIVVTLVLSISLTYYFSKRIVREKGGPRRIAVTLGARGAVGIVIASVSLTSGIIDTVVYSLIVLATLVISLVVPVLLGRKEE